MKQVYKKKPEYLDVVKVDHDISSVNDVIEMSQQANVVVGFVDGKISMDITPDQTITEGQIMFRDKKGNLVVMDEDKLLQYYDLYTDTDNEQTGNVKLIEE